MVLLSAPGRDLNENNHVRCIMSIFKVMQASLWHNKSISPSIDIQAQKTFSPVDRSHQSCHGIMKLQCVGCWQWMNPHAGICNCRWCHYKIFLNIVIYFLQNHKHFSWETIYLVVFIHRMGVMKTTPLLNYKYMLYVRNPLLQMDPAAQEISGWRLPIQDGMCQIMTCFLGRVSTSTVGSSLWNVEKH